MADLICHLSPKKGQGRGAGSQPRKRGPTHLQELRGTGPGLGVLIQGCLQEVSELHRPGRTGGGSKRRAARGPRKRPTSQAPLSRESCVSQTRPSKDKGRLHEPKGGGGGAFTMTFSSRTSLYRRRHGNKRLRDVPEATEQNGSPGVQARAPAPSPGLCHVAAEAGMGSYSHSGFLGVTRLL